MSKSDEKASGAVQDDPQSDSVLDFLYHDTKRIGSFLAQFDDSGHLQEIRQSESVRRGNRRGFKVTAGAELPLIGGGNVGLERGPLDEGSEESHRIYNPLWANARTFLDYLESAHLIHRDVTGARIGQFVLASGSLTVLNVSMLTKVWTLPNIREQAIKGVVANARIVAQQMLAQMPLPGQQPLSAKARQKFESDSVALAENNARGMVDLISTFPHHVQCTLLGANFSIWSSLTEEGLVTSASDLSLKHGIEVPGMWHMLGILDAQPNPIPAQRLIPPSPTPQHVENIVANFSNLGRQLLGRSESAYGMTALMIFREVSAGS